MSFNPYPSNVRPFAKSKKNRAVVFFVAALFFACFLVSGVTPSVAQTVSGTIVGTATDPTGAVIPNATIVVTDVSKGTSQTVQSNASGNYTVSRLIPDNYTIKATAQGFSPAEADNVTVSAGSTQQVNLTFQTEGTTQTITVSAATPPLQTESGDVSNVIDNRQLQDLPNQNRNFSSVALLVPGVQRGSFSIAAPENPQGTQALEVNGSNYGSLGYFLDGTDNREPIDGIIVINPTLDSVNESKVDTSNFAAEFGGATAGVVSAQTRSGSNAFHGDVFMYRRSDALEARDPFTQSTPDPVTGKLIPSSVYSQFGGSLAGPVFKDRFFFFLDYQGTRQKVGTSVQQNVPTALLRSTCLNPASATCNLTQYGGGIISNQLVTPQGRTLLSALPTPNAGVGDTATNNFVGSGTGNNDGDQADTRLDAQVSQNLHAFGRYDYAIFRLNGTPVFGAAGGIGFGLGNTTGTDLVQNQSAAVGMDYALNANLLTDLRFGFLAYHVSDNKIDAGTSPATAAGLPNLNTGSFDTSGSPTFNISDQAISNFGNQNCNCPLKESEQVFQLNNNWTKTFGNHNIRFGGDIRYAFNLRNASDSNRSGLLTFSKSTSAGTTVNGVSTVGVSGSVAGSSVASLLVGQVAQFQRFDVYNQNAANRQKRGAFYVQDSWRMTPKLTVNYGVRWDIIFPETVNSPGNGGFTDLTNGVVRVAGIGGIGTNGNSRVDLHNVGGRFGFAYQVHPTTVIRGAVGQVFDDVGFFGTIFGSALTHNSPVVNSENVGNANATLNSLAYSSYTAIPAPAAQAPIPSNGLIPLQNGIGYSIRPNTLVLPRVTQFNLTLQQQVTQDMTVTIGYVGNIGDRVYPTETAGYNINQYVLPNDPRDLTAPDPTPSNPNPAGVLSQDQRRPYFNRFSNGTCCTQNLNYLAPAARETYNALQTTVQQRFAHGFQLLANYTWSRALNYGGTYFAIDPRVEKGPSDTNRNHIFVFSGIYELPFGKDKMFANTSNRWMNYVIGGWQLAGTTTYESGLPFTPTYAECGADQDVDTNSGSPNTSSDCRPNTLSNSPNKGFETGVGAFDPTTRSRRFFTPVAPLASNGTQSGPFIRPAFGTIGNIGRNSFRGPNDYFADASLFKNFNVTERIKGQFQFQAFNVFNHVPLGLPNATDARCIDCTTSDAGRITSVDNAVLGGGQPYMRQLQFGAKVTF
jgi:hypothetical protein